MLMQKYTQTPFWPRESHENQYVNTYIDVSFDWVYERTCTQCQFDYHNNVNYTTNFHIHLY